MARFQRFNQATGGKTPQYLAAELRRSQLENTAVSEQNANISRDRRGLIDLYDKSTGDNTPIMDGFKGMYDSMGIGGQTEPMTDPNDPRTLAKQYDAPADGTDFGLDGSRSNMGFGQDDMYGEPNRLVTEQIPTGGTEFTPLSAETTMPETGMSSGDVAEEGMWDKVKGIFGGGEEEVASGISDASDLNGDINTAWDNIETADTASNAIESVDAVTDIAGATEMVEGVSSAAEAAEAIDSVAGVASNIGLGGVAGALTAESPEEAALTLAMNTNPYTAAALALYNVVT